jgi:hypothetical protein
VLAAPIEADLEYRGYSFDISSVITIDGQIAAREVNVFGFARRLGFALVSGGKKLPVVVHVHVAGLLVRAFRIEIAGRTVYSESWNARD